MSKEWTGVDLDGTLAKYHPDGWQGFDVIGDPIMPMVDRVKTWLAREHTVKIMTARVHDLENASNEERIRVFGPIHKWCLEHIGKVLPVVCCKDFDMLQLWDDRAVAVQTDTGAFAYFDPAYNGLRTSIMKPLQPAEEVEVAELVAYTRYIGERLEEISLGWTPVCFEEFQESEECRNYLAS